MGCFFLSAGIGEVCHTALLFAVLRGSFAARAAKEPGRVTAPGEIKLLVEEMQRDEDDSCMRCLSQAFFFFS